MTKQATLSSATVSSQPVQAIFPRVTCFTEDPILAFVTGILQTFEIWVSVFTLFSIFTVPPLVKLAFQRWSNIVSLLSLLGFFGIFNFTSVIVVLVF